MITWMVYGRIQEHKKKGFNKSQTSRILAIDYKTILKYWDMKPEEFTAKVEYSSTRIKKAEVYEEFVVSALKEYPDISAAQLYDWIKEKYETDNLAFKERTFRNFVDDKEKVLGKILNGTKTMIVRGAAGRKIPHSRVFPGETLYFMEKGSFKISAKAVVKDVQNYVKLSDEEIIQILSENQNKLNLSEKQKERWHKKALCLVEFEKLEIIEPLEFQHQKNMDDWLIIEKIEDVLEGSSKEYNYELSKF